VAELGTISQMHAVSPFRIDSFEPEPAYSDGDGVRYERIRIAKSFTGDLVAESKVEMLSVRAEPTGAGYVALERIEGTLQGKRGTFALLHLGTMVGEKPWAQWPIAPGSGTAELTGISGQATIEIDDAGAHTLLLDYELD